MTATQRLISIARPYAGRLLLVSVLTSAGALAELVEPWVYRAIINDIAGVFVSKASGLWDEFLEEFGGGAETDAAGPGAPSSTALGPAARPPGVPAPVRPHGRI